MSWGTPIEAHWMIGFPRTSTGMNATRERCALNRKLSKSNARPIQQQYVEEAQDVITGLASLHWRILGITEVRDQRIEFFLDLIIRRSFQ